MFIRSGNWTGEGPLSILMFDVRKLLDELQVCLSSFADNDDDEAGIKFVYGNPACGSLSDYLVAMTDQYGERAEFISWINKFREYLHYSDFNLWLLVLQQPGKTRTVEYIVDFSKYNVVIGDSDKDDILSSYNYYIDTVIGKTMLGFFYKVRLKVVNI